MEQSSNNDVKRTSYFANRNVSESTYTQYQPPRYLSPYFRDEDKELQVLDIGCGLGQFLGSLQKRGFSRLYGVDINEESIALCRQRGLAVEQITDIRNFFPPGGVKYDRIIMSHVLEHVDKELIIDTLVHIRKNLLKEGGVFLLMVPNAQSPTGAYWRYEDFTHTILFTAGSCLYVLKAAGFNNIQFIDPDGTTYMSPIKRGMIKTLLRYRRWKERIWFIILQTSYHSQSPAIFSFEIKVAAS